MLLNNIDDNNKMRVYLIHYVNIYIFLNVTVIVIVIMIVIMTTLVIVIAVITVIMELVLSTNHDKLYFRLRKGKTSNPILRCGKDL